MSEIEFGDREVPPQKLPGAWVSVDEVVPNAWNPNEMVRDRRKELRNSVLNTGWTQPIVVRPAGNEADAEYEIIDGEQRWRVAQRSDIATDESLVPDDCDPGAIPVFVVDVSDEHARVATVQHNRATGHADYEKFADLLKDLDEMGAFGEVEEAIQTSNDELRGLVDDVTATGAYGQADEYESTWRPTDISDPDVGNLDSSSMSAAMEDRAQSDGEEVEAQRVVCLFSRSNYEQVVRALGDDVPTDELLKIVRYADGHPDEFESFVAIRD